MPESQTKIQTVTVDGPLPLRQWVQDCVGDAMPIVDYGIAHQRLGHAPPAQHIKLVQRGGILQHHVRDFTVCASAGMTMGQLQAKLSQTGQFVPLDADEDMTLGEVIGCNVYGPLRASWGGIRDLLLGLAYIDGQGHAIRVGGRTVKNVAGYDVTRFMVGSLGQMGIVHEATLRTYALPEHMTQVTLHAKSLEPIDQQLGVWLLSDAAPTALLVQHHQGQWVVQVTYLGTQSACHAQLLALEALQSTLQTTIESVQQHDQNVMTHYGQSQSQCVAWRREADAVVVKIIVPPAMTGQVACQLADPQDGTTLHVQALPTQGCLFVGGQLDAQQTLGLDQQIHALLKDRPGFRVWYAKPGGTADIALVAPLQTDLVCLSQLKKTMDPHNIFNPGRYL